MTTPWGKAQTTRNIAEGIVLVTTASHGGYKLDRKRNGMIPKAFRKAGGWYEQDLEWAIVIWSFPHIFDKVGDTVTAWARQILKDHWPHAYTEVTGYVLHLDESRVLREEQFKKDTQNKYLAHTAWGDWHSKVPFGYVGVLAMRASDNHLVWVLMQKDEYQVSGFGFIVDPSKYKEWVNHV